jgi:ribulose bisphosphate carboxylase small subunit
MMEEKINDDERLFVTLQKLASVVKQAVEEAIADQKISLVPKLYQRKKLFGWPVELFYKPALKFKIALWKVIDQIMNHKEAHEALSILSATYSKHEGHIRLFMCALAEKYLQQYEEEQEMDGLIAQYLTACFLKELKGEPLKYWAKVVLQGVRLETEKIHISPEIFLRQPRDEDIWLESPFPPLLPEPSTLVEPLELTIMEIEIETTSDKELLDRIELFTKFLRLFRVGGVKTTLTFMDSESLNRGHGVTFPSNLSPPPTRPYTIKQEDEEKLKNFWQEVEGLIPVLHNSTQATKCKLEHLFVANTFYEDALLREGRIEERIARAVMGLEALLLEEEKELAYRLRLRAAKLLGLLGFKASDVQKIIKQAYDIRSKYVHGKLLSHEKVQSQLRKISNLGVSSPEDFLYSILNYLRLLIITLLLSKIPKKGLLLLLDNSFIDQNKERELKEKLSKAIEIVQEVKE